MSQQVDWRYCAKCQGLFFDGYPAKGLCPAGAAHEAAGFNFGLPHDSAESPTDQGSWRYCQRCAALFFAGLPDQGRCPAGGHQAAGYNFVLPHDQPATPTAQDQWRYCGKCHGMFLDGYPDKGRCAAGGGHEAAGYMFVLPHDVPAGATTQGAWRFCQQCKLLYFDGFPSKGDCPAGGGHSPAGYQFVLPHDVAASATAQDQWRFCERCNAMFFDGFPDKGRCPAGAHAAAGFTFVLPHDIPPTPASQTAWRYCQKCHGLFFDGYPQKGACSAGGAHVAAGFTFVLPHDLQDTAGAQANWRFCSKCGALFFDGFPTKGTCAAGGGHTPAGFHFLLPHDMGDSPVTQSDWRYCAKCGVMYFSGFPEQGSCPAGGGHHAAGYTFVLHHDLPENPLAQANWRFCGKCHAMFYDGVPAKGACPAGDGHAAAGFNFVLPHDIRDPFVFSAPIETGGLAALGGSVTLTINLDGSVRWQGHAHDSGADGYDFSISALVRTPTRHAASALHSGHVGGTFTPGSRDHDWDDHYPPSLQAFLLDFVFGQLHTQLDYSSDFGSAALGLVDWAIKWGVGTALGPLGLVVFVGVEVGSLAASGSLVPGARVLDGVLWMAGPSNSLLAILAEGIASAGSRTRALSQEEYDWANAQVFLGALPPLDRLVLTDTIGPGNRAFTLPRFDGKITLNMGGGAFADPRNYPNRPYGQTFIHELVHSCQIAYRKMELTLLADALSAKLCEATGGDPYTYGRAGPDYLGLGLEQQAQIVSDWYSGNVPAGSNQTGIPKDVNSPYFPYITGNVRIRNL